MLIPLYGYATTSNANDPHLPTELIKYRAFQIIWTQGEPKLWDEYQFALNLSRKLFSHTIFSGSRTSLNIHLFCFPGMIDKHEITVEAVTSAKKW